MLKVVENISLGRSFVSNNLVGATFWLGKVTLQSLENITNYPTKVFVRYELRTHDTSNDEIFAVREVFASAKERACSR